MIPICAATMLVAGCQAQAVATPPAQPTFSPPQSIEEAVASQPSANRLASHRFVPVGQSLSLAGLGEILETIHFTEPPAVRVEGDQLISGSGGASCLRFLWREVEGESGIQTLCVVVFEETGPCAGLDPVRLDLNRFLETDPALAGNANLLASGRGLLYAACRTEQESFRLQQPDLSLPALYFTIVDALGTGPYSLGDEEMPAQRAGSVGTFSGDAIQSPWILFTGREVHDLRLTEEGIEINEEDCDTSPSCSGFAELVEPQDILQISFGAPAELLNEALAVADPEVRDRFFRDRIGLGWDEISSVHPDAAPTAFARLASLEVMAQLLPHFDRIHRLRDTGVLIGYRQPWFAQYSIPGRCFPDPAEQVLCEEIEGAIQAEEARRIAEWIDNSYRLWFAATIDYREGGVPVLFSELRPDLRLFEGVVASVSANSSVRVPNIPATIAESVRAFASDVGAEMPVVLHLNGPPITAQTGGPFCEADICPSDFENAYLQAEAALVSALDHLSPEQFRGFGVALFEGSHFDIRSPHEQFPGFALNRVGETGYNHPLLNVWRAS